MVVGALQTEVDEAGSLQAEVDRGSEEEAGEGAEDAGEAEEDAGGEVGAGECGLAVVDVEGMTIE